MFALSNEQLKCMIRCDPQMRKNIVGVFPADHITKLSDGQGLILNTKPHGHEGQHWIAVYNDGNRVEVFDSLGVFSDKGQIDFYTLSNNLYFNQTSIQCIDSLVCGHYCIFYLFLRVRALSFHDFLKFFSVNCEESDAYVFNFINRTFPLCLTQHI